MNKFNALIFALGAALFSLPAYAQQGTIFGGGSSSVSCGQGITGCPSGPLSTTFAIRAVTGTTDTILSTDAAKLVTYSNAGAIAVTLPQATGSFAAGYATTVQNLGAGLVTITPTTSTINGAASITVATNTGCDLVSDGTNWQVAACSSLPGKFNLTNSTLLPVSTGISGFGTGVAAALGANVSGSGAICLATGSACAGGGYTLSNQQFTSGNWYWAQPYANMTAGSALVSGNIYFGTIYVPAAFTMANIGIRITSASAGGNCQAGVYAASVSTGFPTGAPLAVTAAMSTTTAGLVSGAISGGLALSANTKYWLALQCDNGSVAIAGPGLTSDTYTPWAVGVTSQAALSNSSSNYSVLYSATGTYSGGKLPTNPTVTGVQSNAVRIPAFNFSVQ